MAEPFADIIGFGQEKRDLLRRFRPRVNGTSAYDHS